MNTNKYNFWTKVKNYSEKKMRSAWFEGGNCDSKCSKCNQWESSGNTIETISMKDGSEQRCCKNCGHQWRAIFTPAGFVEIEK